MIRYTLLIIFVIAAIIFIIYKTKEKSRFEIYAWEVYEEIGRKIYETLLKKNPDASINEAQDILSSNIDEDWYINLNYDQVDKIFEMINKYLQETEEVKDTEIRDIVEKFKSENKL
ncbi:hypothetical protein RH915_08370 [Serpentinicella sp. ANB-PHB4]|uniref:hypothetical protein n=1 Tax=Serpentinicella sp. ANB-PHB4 TaxID=3074076 RepID=UPI002865BDFC|nr:hypothetical protein [Serpentinicella sp. ANB-PHB4]MDR5659505.1 hypothetical protein [Serpentinicella sp. ANB-PHB4]